MSLRNDAMEILSAAISSALPDHAVQKALEKLSEPEGDLYLVAIGKAAWQMSKAAAAVLKDHLKDGVCITKYGHITGKIHHVRCYEAGHPVPDENSFTATAEAVRLVQNLKETDTVLFLVSGGGSALFEDPLVSGEQLQDLTQQLLASGADITEMNTIRKRLSRVKGGKFAQLAAPAKVFSIVLSDIIGDPLDMIASGPAYPDGSTCKDALRIAETYHLTLMGDDGTLLKSLLSQETPKELSNVETQITGSVKQLCAAASKKAEELGYTPVYLTSSLTCEAKDAGSFLASIARDHQDTDHSLAFICGGETVVHLHGSGKGGRNQELALSAAQGIAGLKDTCIFSVGSDGTDGPTDAAGGYADGETKTKLDGQGISIAEVLENNDAYHALEKCGGLIKTGPTGTNVNDVSVVLIKR